MAIARRTVRVFINWRTFDTDKIRRGWFHFARDGMKPFHVAPLKICGAFENINFLPGVLPNIANPELSCHGIQSHPMRIAQTHRPKFFQSNA